MKTSQANDNKQFNSTLSFEPLFNAWRQIIKQGRPGLAGFYGELLRKAEQVPALLQPIKDIEVVEKNQELVEQFLTTIFPVTLSDKDDFFAAAIPFTFQTIFSSAIFQKTFLHDNGKYRLVEELESQNKLAIENKASAFKLILEKCYDIEVAGEVRSVISHSCPNTGLHTYMEVELDTRFVDVIPPKDIPPIPEKYKESFSQIAAVLQDPEMMDWLPLKEFLFTGLTIIVVKDVTIREIINNIKNTLLNLDSFSDVDSFKTLQSQVQDLVGVPGVNIGITPFFEVNEEPVFLELHNSASILLKGLVDAEEKKNVSQSLHDLFLSRRKTFFASEISTETLVQSPFLSNIQKQGWCCCVLWPLYSDNKFLGTLEIVTAEPGKLDASIIQKAEPAISLFELALKRTAENLDARLDKVIKEQFTAVQSSVEWRFVKAAMNYISKVQYDEDAKVEPVVFENVYPLYGAIDIRNSSTERNGAIQKDMIEQLHLAGDIVKKARKQLKYPLLKETSFKIRKYIHSVSNIVLSDDEISMQHFFKYEIVQLFEHLHEIEPSLRGDIDRYFAAVNSNVDMLYHHRQMFDESITRINNTLARFIDREQLEAQKIFPHYFERFATDGVDFNIYLGQSICPGTIFHPFYLKNIKLWQITVLARAARLTKKLEEQLSLPLQTTQLILANSNPISISFRQAERKFDVDGAYNIRYEIIKKRIDKVHIKESNERLTQPGAIAIVYSQPQEAKEYMEYIEYLQNEGLLTDKVETFELEELQGVAGLKAIRVEVSFAELPAPGNIGSLQKASQQAN